MTTVPAALLDAPRETTIPDRARLARIGLIAACAFSALAGRLCYLARPFDSDGAMFIYMGRLIAEGGRFGHDIVDNKLPSVGLMTSVAWSAFGGSWPCYVLLGAVLSALATLLLARTARRHLGPHAALPAALFALVYLNLAPAVFGGLQLETLQSFFSVLAAAAALEALHSRDVRDAITVGLAAGCAAMLKPTGLSVAAAFAIATLMPSADRCCSMMAKQILAMIVGLALPMVVVLIYLIAADNLTDMPALFRQIARYAANSAWDSLDWLKPLMVLVIAGFPFLVRGGIFRSARDRTAVSPRRDAMIFLVAWVALECLGVLGQRRMYAYHFLVLAGPTALLFGALPRRDRSGPLIAALAPAILLSLLGAWTVLDASRGRAGRLEVSDYLAARTSVGDVVWRDDAPRLLLETNLRSGSRYVLMFLFANWDSAPQEYTAQLLADFDRTRPKYLVLPSDVPRHAGRMGRNIRELIAFPKRRENYIDAWRAIEGYAKQNYVKEAELNDESVWRRR